jgi:curli biogenesis system outer membrane secretion channel CsgG
LALPLAALTLLGACATGTSLPPAGPDARAAVAAPVAAPQRNVTGFADALRCMDKLYLDYGVRDVSVLLEDLSDNTKKISAGTRDMLISALSDMTRRSRALQVIAFGQDANNVVAFLNAAQQRSAFAVVPQYGLRGSITQLDEGVIRRQQDTGLGLGNVLSSGSSRSRQFNVLGLDLAMVQTTNLALVPGVVSRNLTTVLRDGDAVDAQATIKKVGISFSSSFQRSEGSAQALRIMLELASVELFGRLLKLPYWSCLDTDVNNPEVRSEVEDWFIGMERAGELTPFFQTQLRNRGWYDGPVDGRVTPALRQAVAAYRGATGLSAQGVVDLAFFTRFIDAPFPPRPERPFSDAPTAPLTAPAPPATAAATAADPLLLELLKPVHAAGESVQVRVRTRTPAYVYCYAQPPGQPMQRIFPNRFAADPRVTPERPLELPGRQGFRLPAQAGLRVSCLAAPREVYNEVPAALRWGDFQSLHAVQGPEALRAMFENVVKQPVRMQSVVVSVR